MLIREEKRSGMGRKTMVGECLPFLSLDEAVRGIRGIGKEFPEKVPFICVRRISLFLSTIYIYRVVITAFYIAPECSEEEE